MKRLLSLGKAKSAKWKVFSGKDANRWKKEGSTQRMVSFKKFKLNRWWK